MVGSPKVFVREVFFPPSLEMFASTGGSCNFTTALLNSWLRLNLRVSREEKRREDKSERRCAAGDGEKKK